nr:FabD [Schizochytrium sp.]
MPSKVHVLFPGQGSQTLGMLSSCTSAESRAILSQANDILGYDVAALCTDGPAEKLSETLYSQPAIFVSSWIAFEELKAARPEYFASKAQYEIILAGLSLGEYTALTAAGVLSFADGLRCVQERARAMHDAARAQEGGMATVVGLSAEELAEVCTKVNSTLTGGIPIAVANLLFPGCVVVSGGVQGLRVLEGAAKAAGAKLVRRLPVAGAFHTSAMSPAAERLDAALGHCDLKPPASNVHVYANVTGCKYTSYASLEVQESLRKQLVSPVLWEQTLQNILQDYAAGDIVIELGPGKQIGAMLKRFASPPSLISGLLNVGPGTFAEELVQKQADQAKNKSESESDVSAAVPLVKPWMLQNKPLYKIRVPIPALPQAMDAVRRARGTQTA